ncbi:MAG: DUF11 domain-containing protein [Candidatus Doudnabacteria bacterium]|nr:DUF11 domain-containing protein [Candidatus Doudnabacteria bacterium]
MPKISKILNVTVTASLIFTGIAGLSSRAQAAVAFNIFEISYTQETNRDYPLIDARNVTAGGSFSTSQADHNNGVAANAGDEIEFQIYYHNGGITEDEATNVIIKASLPGGTRQTHEVSATIDSDQTSPVSSSDSARGGNITIHVNGDPQTLELISGSVRHFPNRSTVGQTVSGGDNIVSSGINIGTVKGCFDFSGIVTFRARVGQVAVLTRDLSINKKVLNVTKSETSFRDSTTANPQDRIKFEIRFDTTGTASQSNVIVRDLLPTRLLFVSGSLRIDGVSVSNESEFFGSGKNLGTLSQNINKIITFEADVAGAGSFSGTTTLTNTSNVRSDQVGTRQDNADVVVQLVAGAQFSLRKTAFNLTKGADAASVAADPGDIITYTLYVKNSGGTTLTNFTIEDNISDILELAEITNQGGAVSVNSVIRFSPVDVPAGIEISRTFQVRVRAANFFPASSDLVMVNIYGNEIRVPVRKPQVQGVVTPPRTGPAEWLAVLMAAVVTAGYWIYRRREDIRFTI